MRFPLTPQLPSWYEPPSLLLLPLREPRECLQRRLRHVMLDSLRVRLRRLRGHADGAQHIYDQPVAGADALRERSPSFGQEYAAVGAGDGHA